MRGLPLLAGLSLALLTLQLGNWQLRRAAEKEGVEATVERFVHSPAVVVRADGEPPAEWLQVVVEGTWQASATLYLDNRTYRGRAGYHVLTPLHLADGSGWVLVNRGWVAAGQDRGRLPAVSTPGGRQHLTGMIRRPPVAPFALTSEAASGRLWQFLDVERYRGSSGLPVAGWIVQQTSEADDGLVRQWPQPGADVDRHRGYAVQWYGLAVLAVGLSGWYLWKTSRSARRDEQDHG